MDCYTEAEGMQGEISGFCCYNKLHLLHPDFDVYQTTVIFFQFVYLNLSNSINYIFGQTVKLIDK